VDGAAHTPHLFIRPEERKRPVTTSTRLTHKIPDSPAGAFGTFGTSTCGTFSTSTSSTTGTSSTLSTDA
jgi:hypothetical protein